MRIYGYIWAFLALFGLAVNGKSGDGDNTDNQDDQCSCSGLDYTDGGSYLVDGSSDDDFAFTSVFEGCFEATIVPVLVSPDLVGYECSPVESQQDGVEQASTCPIPYSEMTSGTWIIVLYVPEQDFVVQREFNITIGGDEVNTVIVTVTPTVTEGVTSTIAGETVTSWIVETETEYQEPETITGDCYSQTDTVVQYIPGPTTKIVSEIGRLSTAGVVTQYYATTVTEHGYCHWPVTPTRDKSHPTRTIKPTKTLTKGTSTTSRRPKPATSTRPTVTTRVVTLSSRTSSRAATSTSPRITTITRKPTTTSGRTSSTSRRTTITRGTIISTSTRRRSSSVPRPTTTSRRVTSAVTTITRTVTRPSTRSTRRPTVTSIPTSRRSTTSGPVATTVTTRRITTPNSPRTSRTTRRITTEPPRPTVTTRVTTLSPPRTTPTRRTTTANPSPPRSTTVRQPTTSRRQQPSTSRRQTSQPPGGIFTTTLRTGRTGRPTSTPRGGGGGGGGGGQQPTSRRSTSRQGGGGGGGGEGQRPTSTRRGGNGGGGGPQPPRTTRRPGQAITPGVTAIPVTAIPFPPIPITAVARLAVKLIDVTSTVYDTTTITQTIVELEQEEPTTELEFYTTTTVFTPPAQTVCDAETTVTLFWEGPPRTDYEIIYKTYFTWATVWIGQTQYTTVTDYPAMTRCSKGGGWYGA